MRASRGMGAIDKAKIPKAKEGGVAKRSWIKGAVEHPGALHEQLGVPQGQKIPEKKLSRAAKKPGLLGKRARLAETLKGFK